MASLELYWPDQIRVSECIRTEAEIVQDAVLLAVHEPGPLVTRSAEGQIEREVTEGDLLEALMRDASDGSAVLVAITGDSGVGKSHMVRWLHAQLQRHPRRDDLVIVLVPKTASLRQVVERILAPLSGTSYANLQAELNQAVEHLQPRAAAEMLGTALSNELALKLNSGEEVLHQVRQSGDSDDRVLRTRLGLTRKLRDLIRDPDVIDGWFIKVLERIVRQTIEGGSESARGELRRFVPEDLVTPEDWSPDIVKENVRVALQQLTSNDGASRFLAAEILQDALDPALRTVFQFSKALGQRTIEEIVDEIRRELLKENKELVLLIEDFAALAGIQQPLLSLIIAESDDHLGKRIRAPIRTALAVTDGFLPGRQTILTRAKQEWFIPNTAANPEVIIERLTDLAGRYLNAARWGSASIQEQFQKSSSKGQDIWVEPFHEPLSAEDSDKLEAFGTSRQGYPLFPLSRLAIESICQRELRVGNELRFNPRGFINVVLRETLGLRSLFEEGTFPPSHFKGANPPASVVLSLGTRGWSQDLCKRLEVVLDHWAGNPASLSGDPCIGRGVFDAFQLPWPFSTDYKVVSPTPPIDPDNEINNRTPTPTPTPTPPPSDPEYIEVWAMGSIPQPEARKVRDLLASALNERIDSGILRLRSKSLVAPAHIWLPFARVGNPSNEPKIVVGDEVRPLDPILRAGLTALERWNARGKTWDYPRSEEDYPLAQQLLDRLESQAIAWHISISERQLTVLLRVLHRQALLLGLTRVTAPRIPPISVYCAAQTINLWNPDPSDKRPQALVAQALLRADRSRGSMFALLESIVGCYQGDGSTLYAVDFYRLKTAWGKEIPEAGASLFRPEQDTRTAIEDMLNNRVKTILDRYRTAIEPVLPEFHERLGDTDQVNIKPALLEQLDKALQEGLFPFTSCTHNRAKQDVESLSTEEARTFIRKVRSFNPPEPTSSIETQIATWAVFNMEQMLSVQESIGRLHKTFDELERAVATQLKNTGGGDISEIITNLKNDLEEIIGELN